MNIELEKLEIIKLLLETNDESVIISIKNIFQTDKKDFWSELTDSEKEEIEEGNRQIGSGEFVLYEDIIKKYRK